MRFFVARFGRTGGVQWVTKQLDKSIYISSIKNGKNKKMQVFIKHYVK